MKQEWVVKKFQDVVFLQEGPGIRKYEYQNDGYPMINVRCVQDGYIDMTKSRSANYELATTKWEHFQIDEGDILFTISGTIGRSAIVKKSDLPLLMNTSVVRFRPLTNELDRRFLYHIVRGKKFQDDLINQSTGTAIKNVGPSHLKKITISYPPLPEQKRIVAKLDKAFTAIDQAKANVERNLQNAKDLFQSELNRIFNQKVEGWVEKKLGDVCELYQGLAINKGTKHLLVDKSSLPLLRIKDLKNNSEEQYVAEDGFPKNALVNEKELIYTRTGSLGLVFRGRKGVLHNNSFKIIPSAEITGDYFFWWLKHDAFKRIIVGLATKMAQPDITHKIFKEQIIIIPPIEKQKSYYKQIEKLNADVNNIQSNYQSELNSLD